MGEAVDRLRQMLGAQLRDLVTFSTSDRLWQMPVAAALAIGLPMLLGAQFGHPQYGMVASLGGLTFRYLLPTPVYHRMAVIMACGLGMIAAYTLGLLSHLFPLSMVPVLLTITLLASMVARFYELPMPGSLFLVMAGAIGAFSPIPLEQLPHFIGLMTLGTTLACVIALGYSLYSVRLQPPRPVPPSPRPRFGHVVVEPVIISIFVALTLALAQTMQLDNAYWAPVSCLAVMQGMTLRSVWTRQLQRVLGTAAGLLLAWLLLWMPLNIWGIALTLMVLTFAIDMLVVRNYALAVVFITPLAILLAEAGASMLIPANEIIAARFYDTLLGCLMGLLGGIGLHSVTLRRLVRRLVPDRWRKHTDTSDQ